MAIIDDGHERKVREYALKTNETVNASHTENVGEIVGVMVGYLVGDIVGCYSSNQKQVVRERRVSMQINGYIIAMCYSPKRLDTMWEILSVMQWEKV